jgi:hypothetical protein
VMGGSPPRAVFNETGTWPNHVAAHDAEFSARSEALVLMERLADATLRAAVDELIEHAIEGARHPDPKRRETEIGKAVDSFGDDVNPRIGRALRELYPPV